MNVYILSVAPETYFFCILDGCDQDDMTKMVVSSDEIDILEVTPGTVCKVTLDGKAKALELGKWFSMGMKCGCL